MNLTLTAVAVLLLLVSASHARQDSLPDGVKKLAYNPTYEIFFFLPDGRPDWPLNEKVKAAYFEAQDKGGVCYYKNLWYYCTTGDLVEGVE